MTSQHQHSYGLRHPRSIVGMTQPDSSSSSATPEPSSSSTNSSATLAPPHTELLSAIEALSEHFLAFSSRYPPGTSLPTEAPVSSNQVLPPQQATLPVPSSPPSQLSLNRLHPRPRTPSGPTPPSTFKLSAPPYLLYSILNALPKRQQLPLPLGWLSLLKHSSFFISSIKSSSMTPFSYSPHTLNALSALPPTTAISSVMMSSITSVHPFPSSPQNTPPLS